MAQRSPDQRNNYYLIEAGRAGIHKSILAALYATQQKPPLTDGETGLGIAPANRISPEDVNTFPEQVQYAANTLRSLTDKLADAGWRGNDLWDAAAGRYSDRFLTAIAEGYSPPAADISAARLEPTDAEALKQAYIADLATDYSAERLPQNLAFLDKALIAFVERILANYNCLSFQRQALLEAVRLWRKLDTDEEAIAALGVAREAGSYDESALDRALLDFIAQADRSFSGYPNQREALIRLVQLWRELDSREEAIQALSQGDPFANETNLQILDSALIAFVQRIPESYKGKGDQRFALTEGYRLWKGLDSRTTAIEDLGLDPQALIKGTGDLSAMAVAAAQIDRALLNFWNRVPTLYDGATDQREAILRVVTIWRHMDARIPTIQSLFEDLKRMERANKDSVEAMPPPVPSVLPSRPDRWTPNNIQLATSILPSGNFTWAEATRGGARMPPDQATVDAIVRIASLAQEARERIGRPFFITSWYRPPEVNARVGGASMSRHIVGDAINFYCDGLTGRQLYWALDPWWPGGLGRYTQFPYLCHLDARGQRSRWVH
ncbi:D-Ala-D-Ala carboxypeptidase family metallohydrolase [Oscillatoria sp. CS-180]|uniref:D-Ala-D-Ala carboxypeptidase family metallohydrolase n=1 Tax=Oscillatoria sp. CS-180 TaxID=3021720 RepID=UPI00232B3D7C|nr:D-Ala-D-Ala carboxypeptidase family metallohydrolase [Oscillatoria sp. CS-180]MDB9529406.1 D-Ala-D-Ala carboxypeptidase family metallohydrolase [Oscillatoria sp. CS-180]